MKSDEQVRNELTRRELLVRSGKVGAGILLATPLASFLAACTTGTSTPTPTPTPAPSPGGAKPAAAASKQVRVSVWGGAIQDAERKYIFEPFTKETGIDVITTGPPSTAKVKAMVDSGNVEWDLVEGGLSYVYALGEKYFEEVDYSLFPKESIDNIIPEYRHKFGTAHYVFSNNVGYNKSMFPDGKYPQSWADVWDVAKFPGKRTLAFGGGSDPELEFALMADGVPIDKLYPLDVDRALKAMAVIKPHIAQWWSSGAQPGQLMINKQVSTGSIWVGRVHSLAQEGAPIALNFNQGKLNPAYWNIPKGAAHKDAAQKLIEFSVRADVQAAVWSNYVEGPTNTKAYKSMKEDYAKLLPTHPDNANKQFLVNEKWWGENREAVNKRFQEFTL